MEVWKTVRDLRVAAAMAIMDIPVKVTSTVIAATGERRMMYHIGTASVCRKFVSPRIYAAWKSGKLERTEPAHPFLTAMRGLENRRVLLDFLKKPSATFAPFRVGSYPVWQLVARAGCGLPGLPASGEVFATSDLKTA
jgi:hypothetical protein